MTNWPFYLNCDRPGISVVTFLYYQTCNLLQYLKFVTGWYFHLTCSDLLWNGNICFYRVLQCLTALLLCGLICVVENCFLLLLCTSKLCKLTSCSKLTSCAYFSNLYALLTLHLCSCEQLLFHLWIIFPPLFNPPVWWWSLAIVDGATVSVFSRIF